MYLSYEDKIKEIRSVIGDMLANKYALRLTDTTNPNLKVISMESIEDREDINLLIERLQ